MVLLKIRAYCHLAGTLVKGSHFLCCLRRVGTILFKVESFHDRFLFVPEVFNVIDPDVGKKYFVQ